MVVMVERMRRCCGVGVGGAGWRCWPIVGVGYVWGWIGYSGLLTVGSKLVTAWQSDGGGLSSLAFSPV